MLSGPKKRNQFRIHFLYTFFFFTKMNPRRDLTELFPLEVVINIFMQLNITTFETFLYYYWIGPSWRRIFMQRIFPQISYQLARNPPFSTFMLNKRQVMRQQVLNEVFSARIHNKPISFSFPFLFMMYYAADIEIDDESLKYYHGDFYCSSKSIPDVILICGSNCLNTLRIHQKLPRKTVKRTLRNLHNSTKIQTVVFQRALDYDNIPNLHYIHPTLHYIIST
ncbi:hypothetical protein BDC45DRAFT_519898 [Circinella umbellata]|nr:hypothetical protein BDC45DRAFT_519898 [Circinella umbellata]